MAAPYHRLLSKTARALVTFIVAGNVDGADKDHVFPIKFSLGKKLPCVICVTDDCRTDEDERPGDCDGRDTDQE